MDERVRFIGKLLDGESMTEVCREFGISRKTGYKIYKRYREDGAEALSDRSRRPVRYANQLPTQIETLIVRLLKQEATRPASTNSLQQQDRFDTFVREFNQERPHEALGMKTPADVYVPSLKPYRGLPELTYPLHDRDVLVTACGRICMHRKRINLSHVLAGQRVGIKEVDEGIWLVSFMHYDLGYIDLEQKTLQPLDNPFGARVSPMS